MAFVTSDWVRESSTSTGIGDFALAGAKSPGQVFSAVCADGDQCEYSINHETLNEFETGNLLLRTTVFTSSNGNALVNFLLGISILIWPRYVVLVNDLPKACNLHNAAFHDNIYTTPLG